tara:strand:- start:516 stop:827 length:312 start_codon:yes stop_codon:yes gene_type:complete
MNKFKFLLFFFILPFILQGCATVKEGFKSQKKNSTDEFLVEKKSPLVMPPEFDKLPLPKVNEKDLEVNNSIEKLISNNNSTIDNSGNQNKNFENSIIEQIKQN